MYETLSLSITYAPAIECSCNTGHQAFCFATPHLLQVSVHEIKVCVPETDQDDQTIGMLEEGVLEPRDHISCI